LNYKDELGLHDRWKRYYELSRNKHWRNQGTKVPLISANLLYTHRERFVNYMTDNNPTFDVKAVGALNEEEKHKLELTVKIADHWWRETEQQSKFEESVRGGETYGTCIEKIIFNPDLEYGLGEVETIIVDPYHFGWYPPREKDIQKAEAVLHFYPMNIREARRRWPDKAEEIKTDGEVYDMLGDNREEAIHKGATSTFQKLIVSIGGVIKNLLGFSGKGGSYVSNDVLIVECWVKDFSMTKEVVKEQINIQGAVVEREIEIEKPKYPGFIRYIVTCNAGMVVLEDRPNPNINPELPDELAQRTYLYDKFPFIVTPSVKDTKIPWGLSDFEQLEELNLQLDKALSQFNIAKDKAIRTVLVNPQTSGVDNADFFNWPHVVRPSNSQEASAIRYLQPPPVQADILQAIELYKDFFFLIAGTFELDRAKTPGKEVIAYKAIAALLEHAATMMRGKIRNYQRLLRERGRMYISHVQNWYTEERYINYEEDGEDKSVAIKGTDIIVPAKISVVSGSTMPISRVQEREEAIALYQMRAIDLEELLKKLNWPNRREVIRRIQQGPIMALIQRLQAVLPQPVLQQIMAIANMDDKEFQRAVEQGKIKPLIPPQLLGQLTPEQQMELVEKQIELQKEAAQAKLAKEKALTEKVRQIVAAKGIDFDQEKLSLEKLQTLADLQDRAYAKKKETLDKLVQTAQQRGTPPYRERGLKSNNEEIIGGVPNE